MQPTSGFGLKAFLASIVLSAALAPSAQGAIVTSFFDDIEGTLAPLDPQNISSAMYGSFLRGALPAENWLVVDSGPATNCAKDEGWCHYSKSFRIAGAEDSALKLGRSTNRGFFDYVYASRDPVPEPATLSVWGFSALAIAAAVRRRQKRVLRSQRVQAAVQEYLCQVQRGAAPFRELGKKLTELAADRSWSQAEIEEFYDEVVVAIHNLQEVAA